MLQGISYWRQLFHETYEGFSVNRSSRSDSVSRPARTGYAVPDNDRRESSTAIE
jgi:hypothetical protein